MEVNKVIFYLNSSLVHTRTVAPFDADYQYTGLAPQTAYELKAEIYSDNTLIDTKLVNITTETSISWANLVVADYVNRVEADYGTVEDAVVLEADLNTGTEQEYLDAIAIYNPNGGHRTGKIYNVRKNETELTDLGYLANEYIYPDNGGRYTISYDSTTFPNPRIGSAKFTANNTGFSVALVHKAVQVDGDYNFSIYAKAGISNYLIVRETGTTNPFEVWFDILNGTITKDTLGIGSITTEANGWFRLSVANTTNAGESIAPRLYITNSGTGYSAGVGDTVYIAGVQLTKGLSLKPFYNFLPYDLTVTGGGGTRINKAGLVEDVKYYNKLVNTDTLSSWGKTGVTVENLGNHVLLKEDTSTGYHQINGGNAFYNVTKSVEFKKANSRYVHFGLSTNGTYSVIIDLDTVTMYNRSTMSNVTLTATEDGWVRISYFQGNVGIATSHYLLGLSNGTEEADLNYTGSTGSVYIRKPQVSSNGGTTYELKPYQVNTGTAAFPKIDYSTGQAAFLIEPTRTNILPYSNDFTNTAWQKGGTPTITSNYAISPTGEMNATLIDSDGNDGVFDYATLSGVSSRSVWLKSIDTNPRSVELADPMNGVLTALVCNVTNQWQRFTLTGNNDFSSAGLHIRNIPVGGVLVYNAQVEAGATPTTDIVTNGAVVTRTEGQYKIPVIISGDFDITLDFEMIGSLVSEMRFLASQQGGTSTIMFNIALDGKLQMTNTNAVYAPLSAAGTFQANTRYLLRLTKINGVVTAYKDGVKTGDSGGHPIGVLDTPIITGKWLGEYGAFQPMEVYNLEIK